MKTIERVEESIDDEYFKWLCSKVLDRRGRIYYSLLKILHEREFAWIVPADSHRAADGADLRIDFRRETHTELDATWQALPASVLEVLIAFANRISFQTDDTIKHWFWIFMENLGLDSFRQVHAEEAVLIQDILDKFIWRAYDPNGFNGGLFPLNRTSNDQREVELWYQYCEYVQEQGLV